MVPCSRLTKAACFVSLKLAVLADALGSRQLPPVSTESTDSGFFVKDGLCRRWAHQSIVNGTTLYLFGGNQMLDTGTGTINQTNTDFLQLDLTKSFKLASGQVPWQRILPLSNTNPPFVSQGGLYANNENGLVLFDGQVPTTAQEEEKSIWQFNTASRQWNETSVFPSSEENSFPYRKSRGVAVQIPGKDVGYYLGGLHAYQNDTFKGWFYPSEKQVVEIDLKKGVVKDTDKLPLDQKRIGMNAVYLQIGKKGLIMILGGTEEHNVRENAPTPDVNPNEVRINPMSQLNTVWFYDLDKKKWHFQTTSGTAPFARKNFCMVTVSSPDNSTHHVYVYAGGTDYKVPMFGMNDTTYGDMYILSMPSFQYQNVSPAPNKPDWRQLHTCHVINQRQMLVVGGHHVDSTLPPPENCTWDEMHVFDLTTLKWFDQYTPATIAYEVPDEVADNIQSQSSPLGGWDDDALKHIFEGTDPGCPSQDRVEEEAGKRTRDAIIAAGVAGGVAVVFLFTALYSIHRRQEEAKEMNVQLEQLKAYLGFTESRSGSRDDQASTYVSESSRPMTFAERIKFLFRANREPQNSLEESTNYYDQRPPVPEKLP